MSAPRLPTKHTATVASDLDDLHGVFDREVITITTANEGAVVDVDEDVATAITTRHGGVGDVEVVGLVSGADDGVIVVEGETRVIVELRWQHTEPTDIDVIAAIAIVDAMAVRTAAVDTCSKHLLPAVVTLRAIVVAAGLRLLDQRTFVMAQA